MYRLKLLPPRDYLHARLHRLQAAKLGLPFHIVATMPLSVQWLSFISSRRQGIHDPDVTQFIANISTPHLHSGVIPIFEAAVSHHIQPSHDRKHARSLTQVSSSRSTYQQCKGKAFARIDHVLKHLKHRSVAAGTCSLFGKCPRR